jgi:hypothetical protein
MDPLTVFREFIQNGQLDQVEVDAKEGKVRFADKYSFPANAATAFRREGASRQYYPLGVVVEFFKWVVSGAELTDYIRRNSAKESQVNFIDREVSPVPRFHHRPHAGCIKLHMLCEAW